MTKSIKTPPFPRRLWNFFSSVKLSVVILLSLAVTSIVGTVIPQNENPMLYRQKFGEVLFNLFTLLNLFDMYHSWWFRFLLCLLTVNIIVCSINRLSATWKIIFPQKPSFTVQRFKTAKHRQEWSVADTTENVKARYAPVLSRHFSWFTETKTDSGVCLFGEKGRWTRLGVYVVHLSILFLVAGSLIGSIFGFDGYVNIPEGESSRQVLLGNDGAEITLDFDIRCDDFNIAFYDSGMPKEYRSSLSLIRDGETLIQKDIIVNDPLRHGGINIFQSSYGNLPPKDFTVVFTEAASGMMYNMEGAMGLPIEMPGNSGTLIVEEFQPRFSFRGVSLSNVFLCRMTDRDGKTSHILIPADFPRFDRMRQGDFVISIDSPEFPYYTGLQVTKDPGVPIVYAGFLMMIVGCYVTFFMFHQKICVEITADGDRTRVTAAGISEKNRPGMSAVIRKLSSELQKHA